ncbi:MAG: hypothetical protein AVDCRST_MAG50-2982, partial [uncultured Acidimicrobiales bacterium]
AGERGRRSDGAAPVRGALRPGAAGVRHRPHAGPRVRLRPGRRRRPLHRGRPGCGSAGERGGDQWRRAPAGAVGPPRSGARAGHAQRPVRARRPQPLDSVRRCGAGHARAARGDGGRRDGDHRCRPPRRAPAGRDARLLRVPAPGAGRRGQPVAGRTRPAGRSPLVVHKGTAGRPVGL